MYSDQPAMPSSVVIFRKELTRQPASQCRSSILVIFTVQHSYDQSRHCEKRSDEAIPIGIRRAAGDCFASLAMACGDSGAAVSAGTGAGLGETGAGVPHVGGLTR